MLVYRFIEIQHGSVF